MAYTLTLRRPKWRFVVGFLHSSCALLRWADLVYFDDPISMDVIQTGNVYVPVKWQQKIAPWEV